jgi:hypothetical protein
MKAATGLSTFWWKATRLPRKPGGKWNISEFRSVDYEIPVALTAAKAASESVSMLWKAIRPEVCSICA